MRLLRLCLALAALLALPAVLHAGQVRVDVGSNFFAPRAVNCNPGDHVVWVWVGGNHGVTSGDSLAAVPNGIFDTNNAFGISGQQFTWKSTGAGTYLYYCPPHRPLMAGRVIVGTNIDVGNLRITEVLYNDAGGLDRFEISNVGAAATNLGRYRIAVNGTTAVPIALDNVPLAAAGDPNSIITIHTNQTAPNDPENLYLPTLGNLGDANGSIALYAPSTYAAQNALTNSSLIIDFVQWGAGAQPNEATAAAANYWTTGESVPAVAPGHSIELCNALIRDADSWAEVGTPNLGVDGDCLTPTHTTTWGRIKSIYR